MKTLLIASATLAASFSLFSSQDQVLATRQGKTAHTLGLTPETITALEVKDLKASVAWYRANLGFGVHIDLSEMGWVELSTPTEHFMVGLGAAQPGVELRTNGGSAIVFGTTDIEGARTRLLERKVEVGEVQEIPGIVRLLEFQDPDGNKLMLHQAVEQ